MSNGDWKALHGRRHEWAFRAYDQFMESLSPEVRSRLGHKSSDVEAYVVVFGPTQVGKTTLIVDLMGVVPEAMSRVSGVLRGGREFGKSATSTAMEYRRSSDARWGLSLDDTMRWLPTDASMTAAVGELRRRMESRELQVTMPCTVCIPSDCFSSDPAQPYVRMFDLPGDEPANPVEQEHVNEMARQFIPLADLILLVGRSDDLTFLQPDRLVLPGIGNWQRAPFRFRVVTTYSYAPQDFRDAMRKLPQSPDEVRDGLIAEIERAGPLAPDAKKRALFYPLEFGSSWLHARENHADLYAQLSPLIDELKRELRKDILDSTNSLARLKRAASAHTVVNELMNEGLCQIQQRVTTAGHEVKKISDELDQCEAVREDVKRRLKRLDALLGGLQQDQLAHDAQHGLTWPPSLEIAADNKTVAGFRLMVEQARIALRRAVVEARPLAGGKSSQHPATGLRSSFWLKLSADLSTVDVNRIVADAFSSLVTRLDQYDVDTYWWRTGAASSNYQTDRRLFMDGVQNAERQVRSAVSAAWEAAAAEKLDAKQHEGQALRRDLASWDALVHDLQRHLEVARQRVAETSAHRVEYEARMERELSESRRFTRILDECYLEELLARRLDVLEAPTPADGAIALMAAVQLANERRALQSRVAEEFPH